MITSFKGKRISAVMSVIPEQEISFMDEVGNYSFTENQMIKLAKVMGFNKRRVACEGETVADYAIYGIQQMLDKKLFSEDEIGAIIVTTTSPDHFIPPISNIIQGKFDFDENTICIDISQGCCGFIVGLVYSFMTLNSIGNKKILLVSGDMLTQKISKRDRASRPICGDGVAVSIVENTDDDDNIFCSLKNDGKNAFAVYIPAGGTRMPITPEAIVEEPDEFGNWRGNQHLRMNGDLVFNIIINETPKMMEEILSKAGETLDDIDCFICHQSSTFTLKKLAQRLKVTQNRLPNDIVPIYGNSSSATIPVTLCHHFNDMFAEKDSLRIMFAAFGTGMSLGAVLMDVKKFDYCGFIEYPHNRDNA